MRAYVLNGGGHLHPAVIRLLPDQPDGLVVAADSGAELVRALRWPVHVLIGDLDSVSAATRGSLVAAGTELIAYPRDKDATDLELALDLASRRGARRITVLGGTGDRLDHLLGAVLRLAAPRYDDIDLDAWFGPALVCRALPGKPVTVHGLPGQLVSLISPGGGASGVTTEGLRWALTGATLDEPTFLGVSNELVAGTATISVRSGRMLVIQPDAADPRPDPV